MLDLHFDAVAGNGHIPIKPLDHRCGDVFVAPPRIGWKPDLDLLGHSFDAFDPAGRCLRPRFGRSAGLT